MVMKEIAEFIAAIDMIIGIQAVAPTKPKFVITSVDEYEAATARAQELMGAIEGSRQEAELAEISDAIMAWDQRHDDATCWE